MAASFLHLPQALAQLLLLSEALLPTFLKLATTSTLPSLFLPLLFPHGCYRQLTICLFLVTCSFSV